MAKTNATQTEVRVPVPVHKKLTAIRGQFGKQGPRKPPTDPGQIFGGPSTFCSLQAQRQHFSKFSELSGSYLSPLQRKSN